MSRPSRRSAPSRSRPSRRSGPSRSRPSGRRGHEPIPPGGQAPTGKRGGQGGRVTRQPHGRVHQADPRMGRGKSLCCFPFVKPTCSWRCCLITRVSSLGSCGYVGVGRPGAGQGEHRPQSGGEARGQGGRARGAEPLSGGRQGQGRGCTAQGEARYVVGVMSAEFFVRCLVSDLLLFRAGGLHKGQRGAAEAPRGGRSTGGCHRGEASPGAGGSARYDPEIICYVLFVMFFGLG